MTDNIFASLEEFESAFAGAGLELEISPSGDEATLVERVPGAAALVVVYAQITEPVIRAAAETGCRVISRCGIGFDNIDIEAATRAGLQVTYVPDYCLDEVADHTLALLLAFARSVAPSALAVRSGDWSTPHDRIHQLAGRRLALLGVGRIGRRVATRAQAFGLEVSAYDPYVTEWDFPSVERAASVEELLQDAEYISLHAPMTAANRHVIQASTIDLMKRSPVLINTARGGLVDLGAVTAALDDGRLSGVALDVTEVEPLPADHPLRMHPLALITPHMAYYSVESESELKRRAADEVLRALRGEPPRCPVNRLDKPVGS
jgi:D-3-phosphoglycerate dehydrogenase / 2-oxoglutarate reductase